MINREAIIREIEKRSWLATTDGYSFDVASVTRNPGVVAINFPSVAIFEQDDTLVFPDSEKVKLKDILTKDVYHRNLILHCELTLDIEDEGTESQEIIKFLEEYRAAIFRDRRLGGAGKCTGLVHSATSRIVHPESDRNLVGIVVEFSIFYIDVITY